MVTKYDTDNRVLIPATIKSAEIINDKVYYSIRESEMVVLEETIWGVINNNEAELKMFKDPEFIQLFRMCEPVVRYLQNNFHPHTTVVIECDGVRVEETTAHLVKEYDVD